MKKGILLISLAIIFLGALCYNYVTDYSSLTTDSGFDVDYGGGSYGGGYSGSSHGSSSASPVAYFYFFISVFCIIFLGSYIGKSAKYHKYKSLIELLAAMVLIGIPMIIGNPLSIIIWIMLMIIAITLHSKLTHAPTIVNVKLRNECYTNLTPEKRAILDQCYQIFCDVQTAWMNFDYDRMRDLVTDELFNQYQNQLKQLDLKNEKNMMEDFELIEANVDINYDDKDEIDIVNVTMTVAFYDYIVNNKGRIIRGDGNIKQRMTYALTYVRNSKAITNCPNCNAKLEDGQTICKYCHAHIQSVTNKLKLSSKKAL